MRSTVWWTTIRFIFVLDSYPRIPKEWVFAGVCIQIHVCGCRNTIPTTKDSHCQVWGVPPSQARLGQCRISGWRVPSRPIIPSQNGGTLEDYQSGWMGANLKGCQSTCQVGCKYTTTLRPPQVARARIFTTEGNLLCGNSNQQEQFNI